MRTRHWSIRAKIISLLLVPLVTLVVMWGLATAVTLGPGLDLLDAQSNLDSIGRPVTALIGELQAERKLTVVYLASGRPDATALAAQRARTDAAAAHFRQLAGGQDAQDAATDLVRARVGTVLAQIDSLAATRESVDRGALDRTAAGQAYTAVADAGFLLSESLVRIADEDISRQARALVGLGRARDLLAREDVVLSGAYAAGSLNAADLSEVVQLIGAQRFVIADTVPALLDRDRDLWNVLASTGDFQRLTALENSVLAQGRAGAPVPVPATIWRGVYAEVANQAAQFTSSATDRLLAISTPSNLAIFGNIALTGLLGLVTVVVTLYAMIRIARSLIKRLAGLRQAAQELAVDRLPGVVARLRRGELVDVAQEAPALPYGDDEIGQVGRAFNELQRTAVNSAVDEANLRQGLNEVFLNIARRSQTLLHRQLSILDRMERRVDDPTELEDLFRVDHLATRMRRHAEDLVILAGAAPGRGWRNPVPLVDVLRGAVSEVEDYARVSIRPMPELAIAGRAVGDLIHLLAELIENATSFSPPHTRVNVGGEVVAHGFAIEIEDRGLGMSPADLDAGNARLDQPPDFDPANSAQLGLFVVARLAARHGVKVQLRSSAYGGITAVALLPADLIVADHREVLALVPGANGTANGSLYREITTGQRPAIAAPRGPEVAPPRPGAGEAPVTDAYTPPRHARQEIIEAPASAGPDALPRRVRQTSLVPQLRDDVTDTITADTATLSATARTPEQLRAMMSSFQSGMDRGRRDAEAIPGDDGAERDPR